MRSCAGAGSHLVRHAGDFIYASYADGDGGAVAVYTVYNRFQFTMRRMVEASDAALISQIAPVASLIALYIVAGEELTMAKSLAALCILGGNALIVWQPGGGTSVRGLVMALLLFVCLGIGFAMDKIASASVSLPFYMLLIYFLPAVLTGLTPPIAPSALKKESASALLMLLLLAAVTVIGGLAGLQAFRLAEGGSVILLNSSSSTLTVLLGIVVLREYDRLLRKMIAALLVFAGICVLAFA